MREVLLLLAAGLMTLLGLALLALSQERHFEHVFHKNRPSAPVPTAHTAIILIATILSLPLCIASQGASFGCLLWVLLVCAAAMTVALLLTWRPCWLRCLRYLFFTANF